MDKKQYQLSSVATLIFLFAAVKFLIHMLTAQNYGYFVDELYTIAMSKHLAFGYVDLPPLVPLLCAFSRILFGESLLAYQIFPALAGAGTLVFVCLITKELGGRRFAISLAALGFLVAPVWLTMNSFFAYDGFDGLVLSIFLYFIVRLIRTDNKKLWISLGVVAGVAFMTKATIAFIGPGFVAALLILKYRKHLLTRWPWFGLGSFLLIILPFVIWQYLNNWPTIEYWKMYSQARVTNTNLMEYVLNMVLLLNPILFSIILLGLYRIWRRFENKSYSFMGILFIITFAVMFHLKANAYMLASLFIPLIAAGAIALEETILRSKRMSWLKATAVSILIAGGLVIAPLALPILPPDLLVEYNRITGGFTEYLKIGVLQTSKIPSLLSGRFGWDDLAKTVAEVYYDLSPEDQEKCGIFTSWYGQAGAIDLLGPQYGLPHAVSGHLTYYLWGPGEYSWDVMIVVGKNYDLFYYLFEEVSVEANFKNEYVSPFNNNIPIAVCRKPKMPVDKMWGILKSVK